MKTIFAKAKDVERSWYVIDAENAVLGKLAVKAATVLRGKHKPEFAPNQEVGDYVIVVNAEKVRVTGSKPIQKMYYHHTGYPGALRSRTFQEMIEHKPEHVIEHAIRGMLPKNRLGRKLFTNVKVYRGPDHPHAAQKPEPLTIE
ncbi:MAG: 50S ribosomal protein L13 [Spirochaetota bacterium]